ncbi:MAG TPA: recombinase family protein [Candidatus Saccharimonadales bacterium]|nr:recombinase family protein [Candidatus Saccharimonadales bacterium]
MTKNILAIANYRVSSDEQLLNDSLARQKRSVEKAADELGVKIVRHWSGSVSSKKWANLDRDDLEQMLTECRHNRAIKYAIFDELDRFMRSMLELAHFIVEFKKLGVEVKFASQPNLKTDTASNTLILMLEAFKAEGSNEERQRKSIAGQINALRDGRYPFAPKPGYMGGRKTGVPAIHPIKGPALQKVLLDIVNKHVTPSQGLIDLNNSDFMKGGHSLYKMDKFRKIVTDSFYAGVVEIDKQVKFRNENGLHDPLITLEQHYELVRIMDKKKKVQAGPRKNGNPDYPLSNLVTCKLCVGKSTIPRYAGFKHSNGKSKTLVYHKYRCRSCNRYIPREELHPKIELQFQSNPITQDGEQDFVEALDIVWKRKEAQARQDAVRLNEKIKDVKNDINNRAMAAIDPSNLSIKSEILSNVAKLKSELETLEEESSGLVIKADNDKERFLQFAFSFVRNMGNRFLEISHENRVRCKQVVFPAGFQLDANNKVYTPEISPLITLATNKKDLPKLEKSLMVRVKRL